MNADREMVRLVRMLGLVGGGLRLLLLVLARLERRWRREVFDRELWKVGRLGRRGSLASHLRLKM
jgi:hypothetical protein